jgi:hypothetical protein
MRVLVVLSILLLSACSSPDDAQKRAIDENALLSPPTPYQTKVIDFVAERGTRRATLVHLYQRYNAGNKDPSMLEVIESSEAAYEAVTLSDCVNPVIAQDGVADLLAVARKVIQAGEGDALVAQALARVPKNRQTPNLVDAKTPPEQRAKAALVSLQGYTGESDMATQSVALFRANAVFYYYLSLGTHGACTASPELKKIVGAPLK